MNDWEWKTFTTSNCLGYDKTAIALAPSSNADSLPISEDPKDKAIYFLNNTMAGFKSNTLSLLTKFITDDKIESFGIEVN
jgi:hypothetical protein